MNQYYQNKRVLVTGGSSGIGLAIARKLAGMGSSDTYGTIGTSTFPPREVVMNLRLRF